MRWGPLLFMLFILVFFAICIPAAMSAYWCWVNRRLKDGTTFPLMKGFAYVLGALFYRNISELVATGFGFDGPRPRYSTGYAIVFWQGQFVLAISLVMLVRLILRQGNDK